MDANELFPPSDFLRSEDVEASGGEMQLTISAVGRKEYDKDGKKEIKGLLSFTETAKKLSTNVTNTNALVSMYGGKNIDVEWVGKKITLFVDYNVKNPNGGGVTKGIRIKQVNEKQAVMDAFWDYANGTMFLSPAEGRAVLTENGGDFVAALAALKGDVPLAAKAAGKVATPKDINASLEATDKPL